MSTNIGELRWKITGDTANMDKALKKTETGLGKFSKAVKAAFSVAIVALFAKGVVTLGKKMIGLASDAEETANKFNVVFAGLNDAAEAAENLAEGYGFSQVASQELLSSTADLLQGFGVTKDASLDLSIATQELAADLASFSNKDPIEASKALTSALLGEREAVKQLGIAITDAELIRFAADQGKVYNEMTKAEKAVLTLDLAYQQSANSIGDFARSQGSFANQTKIAKANIDDLGAALGEGLLPAATKVVTKFNELIGAYVELREEANELKLALSDNKDGVATLDQQMVILLARQERYTGATKRQKEAIQEEIDALQDLIDRRNSSMGMTQDIEATEERLADERDNAEAARISASEREREAAAQWLLDNTVKNDALRASADLKIEEDGREREAAESLEEMYAENHEIALAREEELARVRAENRETLMAQASAVYGSMKNVIGAYFDYEISRAEDGSEKQAELKRKQFNIQKGFSAVETGIAGAQAAIEAYKALAGIPYVGPVLGALAAVAVGAMTAVQVGFILAQSPPALAEGGVVPASPGGRVVRVAEGGQDEAIVPLDQAGITGGGGSTTLMMDGEVFAKWIQNQINNRGIIVPSGA